MRLRGGAGVGDKGQVIVTVGGVSPRTTGGRDAAGEEGKGFATSPAEVTHRYPQKEVRAFDTRGKPVPPAEVARRLKDWARVLVSQDGKEVDPLHLALFKDGALVLVLPRQVGAPVVLPAKKPVLRIRFGP
jgi:hypothetical protein